VDWITEGGGFPGGRKLKNFEDWGEKLDTVGHWAMKLGLIEGESEVPVKHKKTKKTEQQVEEQFMTSEQVENYLLLWEFEDWLKKWFFQLLKIIEASEHTRITRTSY
jgi:hypothetical protein